MMCGTRKIRVVVVVVEGGNDRRRGEYGEMVRVRKAGGGEEGKRGILRETCVGEEEPRLS